MWKQTRIFSLNWCSYSPGETIIQIIHSLKSLNERAEPGEGENSSRKAAVPAFDKIGHPVLGRREKVEQEVVLG